MSATVLSDDTVNLVSQLAELQSRKDELQERIKLYEDKLAMAREASLALTNEEQELANRLQAQGFYYGQAPPQSQAPVQTQQFAAAPTSGLPANTQDQLAALLGTLFQQQQQPQGVTNVQQPVANTTPLVPTSGQSSFGGGGIYNFPQPNVTPQLPVAPTSGFGSIMAPTSGSGPIRATPKISPTSAPGLAIRRGGGNK